MRLLAPGEASVPLAALIDRLQRDLDILPRSAQRALRARAALALDDLQRRKDALCRELAVIREKLTSVSRHKGAARIYGWTRRLGPNPTCGPKRM